MADKRVLRSQKRAGDKPPKLPASKRKKKSNPPVEPTTTNESRNVRERSENASAMTSEHSPTIGQSSAPAAVSDQSIAERTRMETIARIQAAKQRMEVEKRAIEDRRRLELEMIDTRFQEEMLAIEDRSASRTSLRTRSYCQSSVIDWLAGLPDQGHSDTPRRQNESSRRQKNVSFSPASVTTSELAERLTKLRSPLSTQRISRTVTNDQNESGLAKLTEALTQTVERLEPAGSSSGAPKRWLPEKEFMTFSGRPLDWFLFKRGFEASMRLNRFSDEENVLRLHQCLEGEAEEAVASLVTICATVQPILDVLQLRFGNPTLISRTMAREIRHLPTLDDGKGDIVAFATKVRNCVFAVEAAGYEGLLHSPDLVDSIIRKMPRSIIPHYNRYLQDRRDQKEPILVTLSLFLFNEAEMACQAQTTNLSSSDGPRTSSHRRHESGRREHERSSRDRSSKVFTAESSRLEEKRMRSPVSRCGFCNKDGHKTVQCRQLARAPTMQRWIWATSQRRCFQCLKTGHNRLSCQAAFCDKNGCGRPHHPLLHGDEGRESVKKAESEDTRKNESKVVRPSEATTLSTFGQEGRVLLKVLPITLFGPRGSVVVNALLDEGSTISILNAEVAEQIGLEGEEQELTLKGVMGVATSVRSRVVNVDIQGSQQERYRVRRVKTIPEFTVYSNSISKRDLEKFEHLAELSIKVVNEVPKFLIGQDNWDLIVTRELKMADRKQPVASLTNLGWVVHGYMSNRSRAGEHCNFASMIQTKSKSNCDKELHEMVKANFQLDALGISNFSGKPRSDVQAEKILKATTRRCGEQWETGLLWKEDQVNFPNNYSQALKRLTSLERKLNREPNLKKLYGREIEKLLKSGFAKKVDDPNENNPRIWYLPHFHVTNVNKPGRVRMVFDAAAEFEGVSLNNQLLSGPDLLQSLFGVLLRFRKGAFAFSEDQTAQRFLWREKEEDERPTVYPMTSMIFGAASSPCSAIYVKNTNAGAFRSSSPEAVEAIERKHYMDDYLDSVDSVEEGIKLVKDVTRIHKAGGFRIRKWISNNQDILAQIPESELSEKNAEKDLERVLGVKWEPVKDVLKFDIKIESILKISEGCTKRNILKAVMSVFDPLGMIAPFTVKGRILLQKVWRSGVDWDDLLEEPEMKMWNQWKEMLNLMNQCEIPRCYFQYLGTRKVELHVFADASEEAFAAAAYLRVEYEDSRVNVAFVMGKARVAPVKPKSIPRLELQAALIASRLAKSVGDELEIEVVRRVFWSDSKTVLCWLKSDPKRYNSFVANRLGEIDELTEISEWRWIPSKENVADDATRWTAEVGAERRWLKGPEILFKPESEWPQLPEDPSEESERIEVLTTCLVVEDVPMEALPVVERFSRWLRLVRSSARMLQSVEVFKNRRIGQRTAVGEIGVDLMERAITLLTIRSQQSSFGLERTCLKQGIPLSSKSRILQLTPLLDEQGVMVAEGRISQAEAIPESMKRPIILDGKDWYVRLLINHFHRKYGHQNRGTVINCLREKYAIVGLRRALQTVISRCEECRVRKAKPVVTRMGDLPSTRLAHHVRPFINCGMDYFGPMLVKVGRRQEKRWGVIFTCPSNRAIHLELASSLRTDSAIMAIRRMINRRGWYNGTNLTGADAELRRAISEIDQEAIGTETANRGIEWHFIPPSGAHMGGCWERLVRSVKVSPAVILKEKVTSHESLVTLLTEVESIVNSHVAYDPQKETSLTPNHFLLGSSSGSAPGKFDDDDLCLRKEWRMVQRLADLYWSRWVREYLPDLVSRTKWQEERQNVQEDDIVQIVDNTSARNDWPRGRVVEVLPGRDGRVRIVKVRLARGNILTRPVSKLVILSRSNED